VAVVALDAALVACVVAVDAEAALAVAEFALSVASLAEVVAEPADAVALLADAVAEAAEAFCDTRAAAALEAALLADVSTYDLFVASLASVGVARFLITLFCASHLPSASKAIASLALSLAS
jgi:hypothetical protein